MYKTRKFVNAFVLTISALSALVSIGFLFWILGVLLYNGISYITPAIFTQDGAPPMSGEGGLHHALIGHMILTILATVIGVPTGMLAGTYLSEYGKQSRFAEFIRDLSDIMMSAPSIVIGVFVYGIIVMPAGHFSAYAGSIALAIIMTPIIIRTTDDMLGLVPQTLREAAYALGAPKWKVILDVVYKGAATGITTGILLGIARVAGETAPLLFTAFSNNFYSVNLNEPIASLTVTMFSYASSPFEDWQQQGWAAATILAFGILLVNIAGRIIINKKVK